MDSDVKPYIEDPHDPEMLEIFGKYQDLSSKVEREFSQRASGILSQKEKAEEAHRYIYVSIYIYM
jgi:hypothetical protein